MESLKWIYDEVDDGNIILLNNKINGENIENYVRKLWDHKY